MELTNEVESFGSIIKSLADTIEEMINSGISAEKASMVISKSFVDVWELSKNKANWFTAAVIALYGFRHGVETKENFRKAMSKAFASK